MDIRNFFSKQNCDPSETDEPKQKKLCLKNEPENFNLSDKSEDKVANQVTFSQEISENDIGHFVSRPDKLNRDARKHLLSNVFSPSSDYDFSKDVKPGKRRFRMAWLTENQFPWLVYSVLLKGAFCLFCVLFPQPVKNGYPGAFIVSPFKRYNDFKISVVGHMETNWHKGATIDVNEFKKAISRPENEIICKMDNKLKKLIEANRAKLKSILSSIIFCGTNDLALRGKTDETGNFNELLEFRIESGDLVLKTHMDTASGNAKYTSHQTQNDLVLLCADVIQQHIVSRVNSWNRTVIAWCSFY